MQLKYFTENILPLKDRLFRLALCVLQSKEEAEDIVQEVMLKIWGCKEEINNPAAYCVTVTKNLSLDRLRHKDWHRNINRRSFGIFGNKYAVLRYAGKRTDTTDRTLNQELARRKTNIDTTA